MKLPPTNAGLLHVQPHSAAPRRLVAVALACWLSSQLGCSVWQQARRTLLNEPAEYSWKWDRTRSLKAYRQWAEDAWAAERGACPPGADDEYAAGFRDGFVDYVYAGGDGEPPPVPPRKFWNVAWRNPPGNAAAANWFAGYRHGADVARSGGYRSNGIVPSSYLWGGAAWAGARADVDASLGPPLEEDLGPPHEELPELGAPLADDPEATSEAAPLLDPAEDAPTDLIVPPTTLPEAIPAEPAVASPADMLPVPELAPSGDTEADPASRSTRAVDRFRRAVSSVQFVEPRPAK